MKVQGAVSRFSTIDELLGDSHTRFFGSGFRRVRHAIVNVEISPQGRGVSAVARIAYPAAWSTKKDRELQPHLRTLDAFIIGVQLCEAYIRTVYGLGDNAVERINMAIRQLRADSAGYRG
jgi:avirulence D protein (AvrD)